MDFHDLEKELFPGVTLYQVVKSAAKYKRLQAVAIDLECHQYTLRRALDRMGILYDVFPKRTLGGYTIPEMEALVREHRTIEKLHQATGIAKGAFYSLKQNHPELFALIELEPLKRGGNRNAKFTHKMSEIVADRMAGMSAVDVAEKYGCCAFTVRKYVKLWKGGKR